jgi:lipoprotein-releasing system permease protein
MAAQTRPSTRPFAFYEWMIASRYLRARRRDGFISVIAGFSFLGIMLGVATLIIVLSVMNGFRKEILDKIVGVNGHMFVQAIDKPLTDYAEVAEQAKKVTGVLRASPMIEGQAFASSPSAGNGVLVRGIREADIKLMPSIAKNLKQGTLEAFDTS